MCREVRGNYCAGNKHVSPKFTGDAIEFKAEKVSLAIIPLITGLPHCRQDSKDLLIKPSPHFGTLMVRLRRNPWRNVVRCLAFKLPPPMTFGHNGPLLV